MTENSSKLIEQTQTKDSRKKYQYQKKLQKPLTQEKTLLTCMLVLTNSEVDKTFSN